MYTHAAVIRLGHTDAAGLIYYARLFDLAHEAYEAFLDEVGFPLPTDLPERDVVLPIVHASADYRSPLWLNDRVRIEVRVTEVGERSYRLGYRFLKADGTLAAEAQTVHVAVDRKAGKAVELPDGLADRLASHAE